MNTGLIAPSPRGPSALWLELQEKQWKLLRSYSADSSVLCLLCRSALKETTDAILVQICSEITSDSGYHLQAPHDTAYHNTSTVKCSSGQSNGGQTVGQMVSQNSSQKGGQMVKY